MASCAENRLCLRFLFLFCFKTTSWFILLILPISILSGSLSVLELWHGPTSAFKDMALQILPEFMSVAIKKSQKHDKIAILTATSGDTGKAALEGFKDVENTRILVFYPSDGVSPMQKLQMCTQEGNNVAVCAIEGNFDDAQSGVKRIFTDKAIGEKLAENSMAFSSANSINWGRLCPQIVYYFSAYCDLVASGEINAGDEINVVVPTGNFGNILAAYYAKEMGLPIEKLICASNANNVLTDFIENGVYDKNREFFTTISPSMDILVSCNLERLLYLLSDRDDTLDREYMSSLNNDGKYTVNETVKKAVQADFAGGCTTEEETLSTIASLYKDTGYLCDTHTAVAATVLHKYQEATKDDAKVVVASTASPFKFTRSVMNAIDAKYDSMTDFELVDELSKLANVGVPNAIDEIRTAPVLHDTVCDKEDMKSVVMKFLGM